MRTIRQIVGIDISKHRFDYSIGTRNEDYAISFSNPEKAENNMVGFNHLKRKLMKLKNDEMIVFMEATGSYYEQLAHFFFKINVKVCIVLPNKTRHSERISIKKRKQIKLMQN